MCNHKPIIMPELETIAYWMRAGAAAYNDGEPIPYKATDDAPSSYPALCAWSADHTIGIDPMPVYSGGCDRTIYPTADDNHCFRAWHDAIHLREAYTFTQSDEIKTSDMHCQLLTHIGAPYPVVKAIEADTKGQVLYFYKTGSYVNNQREFVTDCLMYGINAVMNSVDHGARY